MARVESSARREWTPDKEVGYSPATGLETQRPGKAGTAQVLPGHGTSGLKGDESGRHGISTRSFMQNLVATPGDRFPERPNDVRLGDSGGSRQLNFPTGFPGGHMPVHLPHGGHRRTRGSRLDDLRRRIHDMAHADLTSEGDEVLQVIKGLGLRQPVRPPALPGYPGR